MTDLRLAQGYGLSFEDVDYIIDCNIKYRMMRDSGEAGA